MKKETIGKLIGIGLILAAAGYLAKKSELFSDDKAAYAPFEPRQED
ncbi:hypothetical protein [Schleiferilactobacillus shenzhenensis]|uniref:Methanol dehydrogenase n=1 Tax=Schleiferilactobacillus shenzhenensis LY-73 TaxID=1231336 RepID=U4TWG1_9LACO|nr:hypothetical protein [Schleiferilactobacillus shenzhenensis]ERL65722.1 hypothetical protein L248_2408 [Schleiferilactobacillus shenzhenensis LY-73]